MRLPRVARRDRFNILPPSAIMASSDDPIVISGEITRADFDAASKWHLASVIRRARMSWCERVALVAAMLVLFALAILFTLVVTVDPKLGIAEDPDRVLTALIATCLGFFIAVALIAIKTRRTARRIRGLHATGIGPATFTLRPDSLTVEIASGFSSRTPWTAVQRFDLAPRHVAFWHDGHVAQFIPRAIIGGAAAETDLLAAIGRWAPHLASPAAGATRPG
jgi:hypothetical protein